jgi:hypothetical protein
MCFWIPFSSHTQLEDILSKVKADSIYNPLTESDHEAIIDLIQTHPQLARCRFRLSYGGYVPLRRQYVNVVPLFHVCQAQCPLAVIQAVHQADSSALSKVDGFGCTPLLRFCRGSSKNTARNLEEMEKTLRYFAKAQPSAFRKTRRWLPIHVVCSFTKAPPSLIQVVAQAYPPRGLRKRTKPSGQTPLHLASRPSYAVGAKVVDPKVIEYLIQACPEALEWKDADGMLPLHTSCISRGITYSIVNLFVEADLDAIVTQSNSGDTPLHSACYYPSDEK